MSNEEEFSPEEEAEFEELYKTNEEKSGKFGKWLARKVQKIDRQSKGNVASLSEMTMGQLEKLGMDTANNLLARSILQKHWEEHDLKKLEAAKKGQKGEEKPVQKKRFF